MGDFRIDRRYGRDFGPEYNARLKKFMDELPSVDSMERPVFDAFMQNMRFHKRDVTGILCTFIDLTTDAYKLNAALSAGWFHTESIADQGEFLVAFRRAGFCTDCGAERPASPIVVYRGCIPGREHGLAWTRNLAVARWFAMRNFLDRRTKTGEVLSPNVYRTQAPPESILGSFETEEEVLVDYETVSVDLIEVLDNGTGFDESLLPKRFTLDRPPVFNALSD